jgi:hypothetical protein
MISEAGAALATPLPPVFASRPDARITPVAPGVPTAEVETAEQEITRLTWSVLDGSAALADRQRLAELVKAQHARRRRIDP